MPHGKETFLMWKTNKTASAKHSSSQDEAVLGSRQLQRSKGKGRCQAVSPPRNGQTGNPVLKDNVHISKESSAQCEPHGNTVIPEEGHGRGKNTPHVHERMTRGKTIRLSGEHQKACNPQEFPARRPVERARSPVCLGNNIPSTSTEKQCKTTPQKQSKNRSQQPISLDDQALRTGGNTSPYESAENNDSDSNSELPSNVAAEVSAKSQVNNDQSKRPSKRRRAESTMVDVSSGEDGRQSKHGSSKRLSSREDNTESPMHTPSRLPSGDDSNEGRRCWIQNSLPTCTDKSSDTDSSHGTESEWENPQSAMKLELQSKTAKRKERRDRQKTKDRSMRKREREGKKAYYLQVNYRGILYGDGLAAWKTDVNKLAKVLDPSIMDIRQQPPVELATLRRRLRENFEYNAPVDPLYIRRLVGNAIAQCRCKLLKMIRSGQGRPKHFDREIWKRLQKTFDCAAHEEKSERMKRASRSRVSYGRTGPRGEAGIREMLREKHGKSPDYEEVYAEMSRDKGYSGVALKRKVAQEGKIESSHERCWSSSEEDDEGRRYHPQKEGDPQEINCSTVDGCSQGGEIVNDLEKKIAELEAQLAHTKNCWKTDMEVRSTGTVVQQPLISGIVPTPSTTGLQEATETGNMEEDLTGTINATKEQTHRRATRKENSRGRKKK